MFLHLEIQRGKIPMREKKYSKELGGTAGCSMRLIEASQYSGRREKQRQKSMEMGKRELFFGNSWFTSRRLCSALSKKFGHEYFGALKLLMVVHQMPKWGRSWTSGQQGHTLFWNVKSLACFSLDINTITERKVTLPQLSLCLFF